MCTVRTEMDKRERYLNIKRALFDKAYGTLNDEQSAVLDLYLGGYSYAEIAKRTGLTPKAVDNRLQYVKNLLQKTLSRTELL